MQPERRSLTRFSSEANVLIAEAGSKKGNLKDLNVVGCRARFDDPDGLQKSMEYTITIIPEDSASIESFNLVGRLAWHREIDGAVEAGFLIERAADAGEFRRYVDFLNWLTASRFRIDS